MPDFFLPPLSPRLSPNQVKYFFPGPVPRFVITSLDAPLARRLDFPNPSHALPFSSPDSTFEAPRYLFSQNPTLFFFSAQDLPASFPLADWGSPPFFTPPSLFFSCFDVDLIYFAACGRRFCPWVLLLAHLLNQTQFPLSIPPHGQWITIARLQPLSLFSRSPFEKSDPIPFFLPKDMSVAHQGGCPLRLGQIRLPPFHISMKRVFFPSNKFL